MMGIFFACQSLVLVFAPPLHGWLYDHVGVGVPFFVAAGLFAVVGVVAYLWPWETSGALAR
jgi:hypothetical protein